MSDVSSANPLAGMTYEELVAIERDPYEHRQIRACARLERERIEQEAGSLPPEHRDGAAERVAELFAPMRAQQRLDRLIEARKLELQANAEAEAEAELAREAAWLKTLAPEELEGYKQAKIEAAKRKFEAEDPITKKRASMGDAARVV